MKKKSTELTVKEKQNLIDYCNTFAYFECNCCKYFKQCNESKLNTSLGFNIKNNEQFEIDLLPGYIEQENNN